MAKSSKTVTPNVTAKKTGGRKPPVKLPDTAWHRAFIRALKTCPVVSHAASVAKVTRKTAYEHYKTYPDFAADWDDALAQGIEALEAAAFQRAQSMSDTLTIFLLKAHKPEVYAEQKQMPSWMLKIDANGLSNEQLERIASGEDPASVVASRSK